jgi:hypothetical protein
MLPLRDFEETLAKLLARLEAVSGSLVNIKPAPDDWSVTEIACHLVDSASNNHQRFTRLQRTARLELPGYEPEPWVAVEKPSTLAWQSLLGLVRAYNEFVLHLVRNVDPNCLQHVWAIEGKELSLEFLMVDYYRHLQWHIDHLDRRILDVKALMTEGSV